jgi:hypothetical protein
MLNSLNSPVLISSLEGVNNTEDLRSISSGGSRVGENETDGLLGVDNEDRADGERNALGVDVGSVLVINHVVCERDLTLLIANDGERQRGLGDLVDVLDPLVVRLNRVCGESDHLDIAFGKLGLKLGEGTELSRAHGGEVWF